MKNILIVLSVLGGLIFSCKKDAVVHDLHLDIHTPFRTGTIEVKQNGATLNNLQILGDSERSYVFYNTAENTAFSITINRDIKDTGVGNTILVWKFIKSQTSVLYFDTTTFTKTINYITQ